VLVVDEQGRVLSDSERVEALGNAGLEVSLETEPHAWSVGQESRAGDLPAIHGRSNTEIT